MNQCVMILADAGVHQSQRTAVSRGVAVLPLESFLKVREAVEPGHRIPRGLSKSLLLVALFQRMLVAESDTSILIHGESGTCKELVAKTIHTMSGRAAGPMVSLNCPVLSAQLMESEMKADECFNVSNTLVKFNVQSVKDYQTEQSERCRVIM